MNIATNLNDAVNEVCKTVEKKSKMIASMSRPRLQKYSFRFAEQVLNSKLSIKNEVEEIVLSGATELAALSRPEFNRRLDKLFVSRGWDRQPRVFDESDEPAAKLDFLKDRIGVEVGFGHASFLGIDLLKFQVCSYSGLDRIDAGIYVATTSALQRHLRSLDQNWEGSLTFEKIVRYLPHFKSAIQVPIYVIGIDI